MISRRHFLQAGMATSALLGPAGFGRFSALAATQALTQDQLLDFDAFGNVTLVHITDIHAQAMPVFFREPSTNIGVGDVTGLPPHITGADFLKSFGVDAGSPSAYALTAEDFTALARAYGRMGGLDQVATVVNSIRSAREPNMLLLDGGDTWQGSYVSNRTAGQDMVDIMNVLQPDAMTAHWEFTYGEERVKEIVDGLPFPLLGSNIFDKEWDEPAYEHTKFYERGGVNIAVVGQAFPYLPIANPGWLFPSLSFGIREEVLQENVDAARAAGADLVVLLSHNGFDVDRKLAGRVNGIDVILTGHTHDALPEPVLVGDTLLLASGSNGKFVSRLDLDVQDGAVKGRRGNFNGTFDDLICQALLDEREADIALSPGFRWGPSLLPGQDITVEDIHNATAMTYPAAYRSEMDGKLLKDILEDVADNLFNPDPYYQQGGDMVRVGGMGYTIDIDKPIGNRISDMTVLKTGAAVEPSKIYTVSGWASVNEGTEGPAIWDVVENYITRNQTIDLDDNRSVIVRRS